MARLLVLALTPLLAQARLGSGIVDLTAANFDSFVQQNSKVMVDFVDGKEDQSSQLKDALREIRDYGSRVPVVRLDATRYPDIAKRYFQNIGCNAENRECGDRLPQLLWFHNGQPTQYHRMLREPKNIMHFVLALDRDPIQSVPSTAELDKWNQVVVLRAQKKSELYRAAESVAVRHMDGAAFVHLDTTGKSELSWAIDGVVSDVFAGEESFEGIDSWLRKKLTVSEDLPDRADDDGSVVVVGNTFEELVLRDDRDVMLMVYAPWCGFSRKAMPEWAKFAALLHDAPGAPIVAKMDGTRNRSPLPDLHWTAYPTIIYVRKGEKRPVVFDGTERSLEAFVDFAKQRSSAPIQFAEEGAVMLQQGVEMEL